VHRLADYVYFNHSIHVSKGVGCSSCHGSVDQMPLMFQANSLLMEWCLNCHRNTEMALRPLDKVYDMTWQPAANQSEIGKQLQKERNIRSTIELTSCSTCHR
jgi:cytochrome c peroxidase